MPPEQKHKTAAERQRTRRERLKTEGKYEDYKENQTDCQTEGRKKKTKAKSTQQKKDLREHERERKRAYR